MIASESAIEVFSSGGRGAHRPYGSPATHISETPSQSASASHVPAHSSRSAASTSPAATTATPFCKNSALTLPELVCGSEPKNSPGASNTPRDPAATNTASCLGDRRVTESTSSSTVSLTT